MAPAVPCSKRRQAGFALLEVMVGGAILATAMLAHLAGTISHRGLASEQTQRSRGLIAAHQFMERLRADDDWAGLYARCRFRLYDNAASGNPVPITSYWAATDYYPDFDDRTELRVRIHVPAAPDAQTASLVLREDVNVSEFLLPMDLDGDGQISSEPKDSSYRFLPVVVHFQWEDEGGDVRELRLTTLLRGDA